MFKDIPRQREPFPLPDMKFWFGFLHIFSCLCDKYLIISILYTFYLSYYFTVSFFNYEGACRCLQKSILPYCILGVFCVRKYNGKGIKNAFAVSGFYSSEYCSYSLGYFFRSSNTVVSKQICTSLLCKL